MSDELLPDTQTLVLLAYALLVNVVAFGAYGLDKWKAKHDRRRIPEARLLLSIVIGGLLGAWLGMAFFRHKTQKTSFRIKAVGASIVCVAWIAFAVRYWLLGSD
jgi:uncharacterized membrane protein YsdA (DUF1294 family)